MTEQASPPKSSLKVSSKMSTARPFLIGVGGGTASGKSTVCQKITAAVQTHLGSVHPSRPQRVALVSQDSFYRELSQQEAQLAAEGKFNFDHPEAFDMQLMEQCLTAIAANRPTRIPVYDPVSNAPVKGEQQEVIDADVVIVEGILALYCPRVRRLFQLKLFVDADADTRLARRVRRDVEERGRPLQRVLNQYMTLVKPAFEEFVLPTKKFADIIIPRGAENTVATSLIEEVVRQLLEQRESSESKKKSKIVVFNRGNKLLQQHDFNNGNRLQQIPH